MKKQIIVAIGREHGSGGTAQEKLFRHLCSLFNGTRPGVVVKKRREKRPQTVWHGLSGTETASV